MLVSACGSAKAALPASTTTSTGSGAATSKPTSSSSPASTTEPQPSLSAADLLSQATHNALSHSWAHLAIALTAVGHTGTMSADAGPTTGRQVVVIDQGNATVVFVGGTAYIRGDAISVQGYFGFPASQVSRLANQWISLVASDPSYATVTDAVTLPSALTHITLQAPLTRGATTRMDGQPVIAISGQVPASATSASGTGTLYVSAGNQPLPVEFTATTTDGTQTVTFSAWGTPVALAAPTGAIHDSSIPTA